MKNAFILMTAMPPTTGHLQLIQFANTLAEGEARVIICTQPHEPMAKERVSALKFAIKHHGLNKVVVKHLNKAIEQDPSALGFWEMWQRLMKEFGIKPGDYIVASEPYGQRLAEITGAQFFPYDIDRSINTVKATPVRDNPKTNFANILPEFQPYLRPVITVFGAESTGKTTLSRQLAKDLDGYWLFEYARPYLEQTVNEITVRSMTAIWKGQAALQKQAQNLPDKPYVVQDTDLFSTVGYWQFPHWRSHLGECPERLIEDALKLKSDLYIVTKSNIPFEKDPLRYGGDKREGSDEYWIDVCEKYELPYVVLENNDPSERLRQAKRAIHKLADKKFKKIAYDRHGL
jgi:HTH-type transcriptional repressor of NAD biosynthesis genes